MNELMNHEKGFSKYLVDAWSEFRHSYLPPKGKVEWKCNSLEDACKQYKWVGLDREENNAKLDDLTSRLRQCLQAESSDNHELHHICLEILEWGGVEGVSSAWFRESCAKGTLREKINKAIELLRVGTSHKDWKRFDNKDLVMNSALTKVYAVADPDNIPIYDGRVGAALGLLARKYLENFEPKPKEVPAELSFRWGQGQAPKRKGIHHPRNPSNDHYKFESLRPSANDHEEGCWMTGKILRPVVASINAKSGQVVQMRDLDDALFMIGRIVHQEK